MNGKLIAGFGLMLWGAFYVKETLVTALTLTDGQIFGSLVFVLGLSVAIGCME